MNSENKTSSQMVSAPSLTGRAGGESGLGGEALLFLELIIITVVSWFVFDPAIVNLYYRHLPLGYDADRLLYAKVAVHAMTDVAIDPYEATEERKAQLIRQLKTVEGVENAYLYDLRYSSIGSANHSYVDVSHEQDTVSLGQLKFVPDAHFFETYGIHPLAGSPSEEELSHIAPLSRQAVLTRSAATSLFGTADVAGRHFQILYDEPCDMTVAGVVEDIRMGLSGSARSLIMLPEKLESTQVNIIIRLKDGLDLRRFIEEHGRELIAQGQTDFCRISSLTTFRDHLIGFELDAGRQQEVSRSLAMALFFLLNLVLAVVGTVWLQAKRRTEECGVRRAFGATRLRLLLEFLGRGAVMTTVAVLIGCIIYLNYAYSGLQSDTDGSQFFDTMYTIFYVCTPSDRTWVDGFWTHFLTVSAIVYLILLLTVLVGTAIPAWRICRTEITDALKEE